MGEVPLKAACDEKSCFFKSLKYFGATSQTYLARGVIAPLSAFQVVRTCPSQGCTREGLRTH